MGAMDLVETPCITLEEVANDGSSLTNPAADHRRLFLGEDGLLHVKDSSGSVTNPYSGGGAEFATAVTTIATAEGTTSGSFVDLSTAGPSVTVTIGASGKAKLTLTADIDQATPGNAAYMAIVISGASTVAVSQKLVCRPTSATATEEVTKIITGLTPGSTTFKMQYAAGGGTTATFSNRSLIVEPVL